MRNLAEYAIVHRPQLVVGAAIVRDGRLLAARRTEPAALAGGWELAGGKVDPGETPEAALVREVREELGVEVTLGARVEGPLDGDWPLGQTYRLRVWLAEIPSEAEPSPIEAHDAVAWLSADEFDSVRWLEGDVDPALSALTQWLSDRV